MAIEINIELDGSRQDRAFKQILDDLDKVARRFDVLNGKLLQMAANMQAVASAASGVNMRGRGGSPSSGRGAGARSNRVTPPPFDHQGVLNDPNVRALVAQGDPNASRLFNRATAQQRSISRAQNAANPPGMAANLQSLLMRSRFGGGGSGGVMPLGMDVAKLFGGGSAGGAKGGAIAIVAVVAMKALQAWASALQSTIKHLNELSNVMVGGGGQGGAGLIGAVAALKAFAGGDPRGAIQGRSGIQKAFGAAAGVSPFAGDPLLDPGGSNRAYMRLARQVSQAAESGGFRAAQVAAERLGVPELAKLGLLGKGTRDRLMNEGGGAATGVAGAAAVNLQTEFLVFVRELKKFFSVIAIPGLKLWGSLLGRVNDALIAVNKYLEGFVNWIQRIVDSVKSFFGIGDANADVEKANERDRVMQEHTRAMRDHAETLGGGRRAQGAMPRGISGKVFGFDQESLRESVRMGALV